MPRSHLMAKTKKFEYKITDTICIECFRPARKRCRRCNMPLCNIHALVGNRICESCREDDNYNGTCTNTRIQDLYN